MSDTRVEVTIETRDDEPCRDCGYHRQVYYSHCARHRKRRIWTRNMIDEQAAENIASLLTHVRNMPPLSAETREAQRQSWVRGEMGMGNDAQEAADRYGTPKAEPNKSPWYVRLLLRLARWVIKRYIP